MCQVFTAASWDTGVEGASWSDDALPLDSYGNRVPNTLKTVASYRKFLPTELCTLDWSEDVTVYELKETRISHEVKSHEGTSSEFTLNRLELSSNE